MQRITNDNITKLEPNEVFVFGSNLSGIHGGGAAKAAMQWGAIWGQGIGIQGQTYALPTKSKNIERTLTVEEIQPYVNDLVQCAKENPEKIFLVTEVGCGLAGHIHEDIAPLFIDAIEVSNIHLPTKFWNILNNL